MQQYIEVSGKPTAVREQLKIAGGDVPELRRQRDDNLNRVTRPECQNELADKQLKKANGQIESIKHEKETAIEELQTANKTAADLRDRGKTAVGELDAAKAEMKGIET